MKKKTVFVGMSGGVDSSVSAALLKEQGYDVVGVFMKVWSPEWMPCLWPEERRDAMRVAAVLDIPLLTFDFEKEYKQGVIDYMIAEYRAGRTPNPDVMCNREVKFGAFLKKALSMGADAVATGHYAQVREKNGVYELSAGKDQNKDQSYFLWTLTQTQLSKVLFPIGHLEKPRVRELAAKFSLPVAEKKDSQGLCFVGHVDIKDFLKRYIDVVAGEVVNEQGEVIGVHDGATLYTIGERHGFLVAKKTPEDKPYFITRKDVQNNRLVVSADPLAEAAITDVLLEDMSWTHSVPSAGEKIYSARVRYRQVLEECRLIEINESSVLVRFTHPVRAVTPGQSLVLYEGDVCLGGGVIV